MTLLDTHTIEENSFQDEKLSRLYDKISSFEHFITPLFCISFHKIEELCRNNVNLLIKTPLCFYIGGRQKRCCQTNEPKHQHLVDGYFYEITKERHSVRAASRLSLNVLRFESDLCELNKL